METKEEDVKAQKSKVLSNLVNSMDLTWLEAIFKEVGLEKPNKIIHRLNSFDQKKELLQKISQIWTKIDRIDKEKEQQFETFRINDNFKQSLHRSNRKIKVVSESKKIF